MILGISGAHRTGKTTLARQYAEDHNMQFLETSVSAIFKELGKDPAAPMTFLERLEVQEVVLERLDKAYSAADLKKGCVTDRTPLDLIAYTMADAIGDAVPEELQERFAKYVNDCFAMTSKYFGTIALVQPGLPLVHADGKAAINLAYIEHLNTIFLGLLSDSRLKIHGYTVRRDRLSMIDRLATLAAIHAKMTSTAVIELDAHYAAGGVLN